jgi:ABC-type transport system involved in cytochrome bd biosynthesis fused ATPase/permease subunit
VDAESASQLDRASLASAETQELRFELRDVSVMFPEGKMSVVTGPTASGKTALLVCIVSFHALSACPAAYLRGQMALLGELTTVEGRIVMRKDPSRVYPGGLTHTISYAAQQPWLRHQSIKDNVLFGYPLDEVRYRKVIEACALLPDLAILEDGDDTEIGARGVSLSGGQKAR